ncbi:MAG: hypothetical protein AB7O04_13245 [Hyphomonadaceae bacterium]
MLLFALALGAASCAGGNPGVEAWKKQEAAKCLAMTDPIRREQCREQVETVATERSRQDEDAKPGPPPKKN